VGLVRDLSVPVVRSDAEQEIGLIAQRGKEEEHNVSSDPASIFLRFSVLTNLVDSLQSHCDELRERWKRSQ
jgi:hypothetical protein